MPTTPLAARQSFDIALVSRPQPDCQSRRRQPLRQFSWDCPLEQIPPKLKTSVTRICSKILIWRESLSAKRSRFRREALPAAIGQGKLSLTQTVVALDCIKNIQMDILPKL
jgi:hypothetical protein